MPSPELVLTTPAEAERIAMVRRALGGFTRVFGADEALVDDILTAVSEACTNAVLHAYPDGEQGAFQVEIAHDDPCLFIRVRDWGSGMQPEIEGLEGTSLRLGISLMSALADEFQVRSGPAFGTEVALTFDLDREPKAPRQSPPAPEVEHGATMLDADGPGGLAGLKSALSMFAAQANFSLDRLADLQLLSEVLFDRRDADSSRPVRVAVAEEEGGLRLEIGPLPTGVIGDPKHESAAGGAGTDAGAVSMQRIVERLAGPVDSTAREDGEYLQVLVRRS